MKFKNVTYKCNSCNKLLWNILIETNHYFCDSCVLISVQEATVIEFNPVTNMVVLHVSSDNSRKFFINCLKMSV